MSTLGFSRFSPLTLPFKISGSLKTIHLFMCTHESVYACIWLQYVMSGTSSRCFSTSCRAVDFSHRSPPRHRPLHQGRFVPFWHFLPVRLDHILMVDACFGLFAAQRPSSFGESACPGQEVLCNTTCTLLTCGWLK